MNNTNWYKTGIIYEIYPAGFTQEGLQGVINKLDYIKMLGADAIWLCPIFKSPFVDSGYDVSDYYSINERFGTISDFDKFIKKAHDMGLKIILDIALNHTSNKHYWFKEACKSKDSVYRDYYIFRDGKNETCPNNWVSSKTLKPTWTYNEATNDYYLHIYTKYQPDLNWRSERLRNEIYDILEFWIQKNVDGFRLDVINKIAKPSNIENVESDEVYADYLYENHDDSHRFIQELRQRVFDKHECILMLGQTSGVSVVEGIQYGNKANGELDLFLQFDHMDMDGRNKVKLQQAIMKWQNIDCMGAWPTLFMGSHDSSRMVNKFATSHKEYIDIAAKMLCALQLCLKGTQIIYMGDELAIFNQKNNHIDEFDDIRSKDIYYAKLKEGNCKEKIVKELNYITRDNARRQMPWEKAVVMQDDNNSVLSFYKKIIEWRRGEEAIMYGRTVSIHDSDENIFGYQRIFEDSIITVLANMSDKEVELDNQAYGREIISNYKNKNNYTLLPYQVRIYKRVG